MQARVYKGKDTMNKFKNIGVAHLINMQIESYLMSEQGTKGTT